MHLTLFYCFLFHFGAILELIFIFEGRNDLQRDSVELPHIFYWVILTDFRKVLGFQAKNKHSVRKPQGNGGDRWHFQTCYTAELHVSRQFCCGSLAFPRAADVTPKSAFTCTGWNSRLSKIPPFVLMHFVVSVIYCSLAHISYPSYWWEKKESLLMWQQNPGYCLWSCPASFQEGKKEQQTITRKHIFNSNSL